MSQPSREEADEEVREALEALEKAREHYRQMAQRYMYEGPVDEADLGDLEAAWDSAQAAEKKFNETCIRINEAYH